MHFYDLSFKDVTGKEIHFSVFKEKVCLVVNIASQCRFTPQLHHLQTLYLLFKNRRFEILAFPSNDFGRQEPLDNPGIDQLCQSDYHVTFPVFEKSHVVGKDVNQVYKFLSSKKLNHHISSKPWWNFHKYLIDSNGNVLNFFYTFTRPRAPRLMQAIERLL